MNEPHGGLFDELDPARLLAAFDRYVPGALYVYRRAADGRSRLLYLSAGAADLYGHAAAELLADPRLFAARIHPEDRAVLESSIAAAFATTAPWRHEFRVLHPARGTRHVAAAADVERAADGSLLWFGHLHDITALKRVEVERLALMRRYQGAIELIGDGAWFYDLQADIFSFSPSWHGRLDCGDAPEVWRQRDWIALIDPGQQQAVVDATTELALGRSEVLSCEYRIRARGGEWRWLHARGAVIERDEQGAARLLSGTFADITARKEDERRMRVQARVMEAAPIGLFVADPSGEDFPLVYANPACRALFELPADGAPRTSVVDLSRHADETRALLRADLRHGRDGRHLWHHRRGDGAPAWLRVTTSPMELDSERPRLIGTVEDVSEDYAMRERLVRAREVAEQANEAKSRFIAHVSHELRTPLHGIMGLSELVASDTALPDQARRQAGEVHRAAQHLLTLIGDIIDMSAMEAGRLALSIETVPVARIIERVLRLALPVANEHGVALLADERLRGARRVRADSTRATQVLLNLVSNGIKYNRAGGCVALRLEQGPPGMLRIGVEDDGAGIAPEALDQLFEQFNRLGRELSAIEGSGIGLTIARNLAEAMGGALGVESRVGAGSMFWLDLPAAPDGPVTEETPTPGAPVTAPLTALRVLVAEDNVLSQDVFRRQLARLGCAATIVGDGVAAWDCWQRDDYDVLLTDVHMPGLDGLELARRIRGAEAGRARRTFIVGVSANALKEAERSALLHGMDDYVTKPLTLETLRAALARFVVPAPAHGANPVDAAEDALDLTQLARYVGDEPEVLAPFVLQLEVALAEDAGALRVALDSGALAGAREIAHRLKTTARTAGAGALVALCEQIEQAEDARALDTCRAHAEALGACMARIDQALAAQRALLPGGD